MLDSTSVNITLFSKSIYFTSLLSLIVKSYVYLIIVILFPRPNSLVLTIYRMPTILHTNTNTRYNFKIFNYETFVTNKLFQRSYLH